MRSEELRALDIRRPAPIMLSGLWSLVSIKTRPVGEDLLPLPGAAIAYCLLPIALQLSDAAVHYSLPTVHSFNSTLHSPHSTLKTKNRRGYAAVFCFID